MEFNLDSKNLGVPFSAANGMLLPLILLGALTSSCARQPTPIVFDKWWTEDYAKSQCLPGFNPPPNCEQLTLDSVREFESLLQTEFSTAKECAGLSVYGIASINSVLKEGDLALKGKHWTLFVDFKRDANLQPWTAISFGDGTPAVRQGSGTAAQIAKQACLGVRGIGADVHE